MSLCYTGKTNNQKSQKKKRNWDLGWMMQHASSDKMCTYSTNKVRMSFRINMFFLTLLYFITIVSRRSRNQG